MMKRHCRQPMMSVTESSESDMTDSTEPPVLFLQHTKRRRKNEVSVFRASKLTSEVLSNYLKHVEYCSCPTEEDTGEELEGGTSDEVIQNLLDDMTEKKFTFPVRTYHAMIKDTNGSMPADLPEEINQSIIVPMVSLLEKMDFTAEPERQLLVSYRTLQRLVQSELHIRQTKKPTFYHILDKLYHFLRSSLSESVGHGKRNVEIQQEAQAHLVNFWNILLKPMQYTDKDDKNYIDYSVSKAGDGKNRLVKLRGMPGDNLPTVLVDSESNILCETMKRPISTEETLAFIERDDHSLFRSLSIHVGTLNLHQGVKTSVTVCRPLWKRPPSDSDQSDQKVMITEMSSKCCKSISGSFSAPGHMYTSEETDNQDQSETNDPDAKTVTNDGLHVNWGKDFANKPSKSIWIDPGFGQLRTQHFMDLVSFIASREHPGTTGQVHGIGIYVVMPRVYVTGVFVTHEAGNREFAGKVIWVHDNRQLQRNCLRYRMVCCKYFNIFRPAHFKALYELLQYLVYHQHREKYIF